MSSDAVYTAAVVGLGRIGLGYDLTSGEGEVLTHTRAFLKHPGFRLVAGVDPEEANRLAFERFSSTPSYASVSELLAAHRPQVVAVGVPTELHLPVIERILDASPETKLILCEKPLAKDVEAGRKIISCCEERGVALAVNYMRRYDPAVRRLRTMLNEGELGDIYKGTLFYSKGLLHNGSHYIDLLIDWLGPVVAHQVLDPGPTTTFAGPEPDVIFTFRNGCRVFVLAGRESCYSMMELELVGTKGRVRYGNLGNSIELWTVVEDPTFPGYRILSEKSFPTPPDLLRYQYNVADALHAYLADGTPLPTTGVSALEALTACLAAEADAR